MAGGSPFSLIRATATRRFPRMRAPRAPSIPHSGVLSEEAQPSCRIARLEPRNRCACADHCQVLSPRMRATEYQRLNAGLALSIAEFLPVLRDPRLGAYTVREHFADTELHLTAEGAERRTDELADLVKHWRVWTIEELSQVAHAPDGALAREEPLVSRLSR